MMNLKTVANTRVDRLTFWIIFTVVVVANFVLRAVVDAADLSPARWVVSLILIWGVFSLVAAGRARDMGRSGWFALLMLIPVANLAVVLWLGCSPRVEDAAAAEAAANAAVLAAFGHGSRWMSLTEISAALGDDWEATILRVRMLDAQGMLTNNGLQGQERRYRIA